MKKILIIIFLIILNLVYANEINFEKINEIVKGGDYHNVGKIISEDNYLYIVSYYALEIYNINANGSITLLSRTPIQNAIISMKKIGNIIMLKVQMSESIEDQIYKLYQIDVLNPEMPLIINVILQENGYFVDRIERFGNYFVYDRFNSETFMRESLVFIDPISFEEIAIYSPSQFECFPTFVKDNIFTRCIVLEEDNYVFEFFDFSNFQDIFSIGTYVFNSAFPILFPISENLMVASEFTTLVLYDISDINNISAVGTYDYIDPYRFKLDFLKVEDYLIFSEQGSLIKVIDISDYGNISLSQVLETPAESSIAINNNNLYMGSLDNGICIFDFTDGTLTSLDSVSYHKNSLVNCRIHQNYLLISNLINGLDIYNLEDPTNPEYFSTLFQESKAEIIDICGEILYTKCFNWDEFNYSLIISDISDVENPIILSEIEFENNFVIQTFFLSENHDNLYAVISYPNSKVIKYNISNFENIETIFEYDLPNNIKHNQLIGDYLYTLQGNTATDLYIFSGMESNTPNYETHINQFSYDYSYLQKVGDYLRVDSIMHDPDRYFSLDNPIQPHLEFQNNLFSESKNILENDFLFSSAGYELNIFDLSAENDGTIYPYDKIYLNSLFRYILFYETEECNYFYAIQAECISIYEYNIIVDNSETEIQSILNNLSNYPNPFNPTTQISYNLPMNVKEVSIEIYNIKGQKIKSIECDNLSSGKHNVIWKGKDNNNNAVSSGVYLYKLIINKRIVSSSKMMLIK